MRKHRSDSTISLVEAAQRPKTTLPDHLALRECDLPYWKAAIACRDDWKDCELGMVARLARDLADSDRLQDEIDQEGVIINGKANPKFRLADIMTRRALTLTRHLQIHARATRGEARDAARRPPLKLVDDDLIPGRR